MRGRSKPEAMSTLVAIAIGSHERCRVVFAVHVAAKLATKPGRGAAGRIRNRLARG